MAYTRKAQSYSLPPGSPSLIPDNLSVQDSMIVSCNFIFDQVKI